MKKLFLSALFVSFSTLSFACKPNPMVNCKARTYKVDVEGYKSLLNNVKKYQAIVDKYIQTPEISSSCFNNHFAVTFGDHLLNSLTQNQGTTCAEQVTQFTSTARSLIDAQGETTRALAGGHRELKILRHEIGESLKKVLP